VSGPGPEFPTLPPTTGAWREHALTTISELEALKRWLVARMPGEEASTSPLVEAIDRDLEAAYESAGGTSPAKRRRAALAGAGVERTMSRIDAAQAGLLRLAPLDYLRGQLPALATHVRRLPTKDPRRLRVEQIARAEAIDEAGREAVIAGVRAASWETRYEITRVRSFRNVLWAVSALLTIAAVGMAALGALQPSVVPLCFNPGERIVCPTEQAAVGDGAAPGTQPDEAPLGQTEAALAADAEIREQASPWDIPLVELIGLVAGALAAAVSLRSIKGTSTPYSLPVALAVLKLPTGALTALLGLVLMAGGFVPGLSALDSPAQIVAWAVVFGYSQQVVTRLADQKAQTVLDGVGREKAEQPAPQ
jgi:hypothetical protein